MKNFICLFITLCFSLQSFSQMKYSLNSGENNALWYVKDYHKDDLSTKFFNETEWIPATVPGTIFVDAVNAGLEKEPNFGDNIYQVDKDKYNKDHIYRLEFNVPENKDLAQKRIWLNFDGINRFGEIYLNNNLLGSLKGMMMRGRFDVTKLINKKGTNLLSVIVSLPNQRRHPEEKFANLASPTYLSSAGWDWMPYVPGLNTGITDNVYLTFTQDVTLQDPWIRTKLHNRAEFAEVEISTEIENCSSRKVVVELSGVITPGNIKFRKELLLEADTAQTIILDGRVIKELRIKEPRLWWPNGMGETNLYECKLAIAVNGRISDEKQITFGIREYTYRTDENGVFNIYVNGKRTFLKGGNWGMSEYLLRCRGKEYFTKVRLHKEMNFNIIRNWMGSTTDKEFYEACDLYGIMVWDDFWLNSKFGVPEFPDDFNRNAVEKIKRFRNHPSIVVWCGENEGTPGNYGTGESLDRNLAEYIAVYDASSRHYQSDSRKGNGLSGSGLWKNYKPSFYFADASNSFLGDKYPKNRGWGLRSEIGTAVFTTFESFKEFMPKEDWWPKTEMWNKHFFGSLAKNGGPDVYEKTIVETYGSPTSIEDFCEKAQLVNIETNKAMFEAWSSKMWNDASGIMIWMSQSAYPSFVWQTYDYYYDLTGAYWGAKKGCEPLHILWDSHTDNIMITNSTYKKYDDMTAVAMVFNQHGKQITSLRLSEKMNVLENSAMNCFRLFSDSTGMEELTDVNFLRLALKNSQGKTVSSNDYWFGKQKGNCRALTSLPKAQLSYYISRREAKEGRYYLDLRITNKSDVPAFAVRSRLVEKESGKRILPVIQSDDYIILMPKEVKTIFFEFEDSKQYNHTTVQARVKQFGYEEEVVE